MSTAMQTDRRRREFADGAHPEVRPATPAGRPARRPLDDELPPAEKHHEELTPEPEQEPAATESKRPKKNKLRRLVPLAIGAVLAVALVLGVRFYMHARAFESTDDAFLDAHVVGVSTKIAGYVDKVAVDDNQHVKKGDLLVQIDARDVQARLEQASASVAAARSAADEARTRLDVLAANVTQGEADVQAAKTTADLARRDAERYRSMPPGAASEKERDDALAAAEKSAADVGSAEAKLAAARAQLVNGQSAVKTAEAAVQQALAVQHQAQLDLDYTRIVAPNDGRVTRRTVESGAYVNVGQALLAVVPDEVWVTANFKETQLTQMRPGQPVDIEVDAYPQHAFKGHVDSIQSGTGAHFSVLPPENATGNYVKVVQRVPVKIVFDEKPAEQFVLAPGMSVVPDVKVK